MLLAGAGAASGLVGGPLLSAAVGAARAGLGRLGGSATSGILVDLPVTAKKNEEGNTVPHIDRPVLVKIAIEHSSASLPSKVGSKGLKWRQGQKNGLGEVSCPLRS